MTSFAEQIKVKAGEIGFEKVGIVAAEPLTAEGGRLQEWLGRGYHGEMDWIAREPEKRSDPRLIFPEAKSIIVVALNYYTGHKHTDSPETGKISRYAWGDDYHDVVREKLKELLAWIKVECPEVDGKICVDTAPMMDKAWAVRAGLGWIGKHSNLITKEIGSWVFIGEIILNIDLDYDTQIVEDHCGTCTACLDACPTKAIVAPYIVDSKRCLSYATIELRSPTLPDDIVNDLDGWLYGCDVCQDVCPWNRFQTMTEEQRFEPRKNNVSPNLQEILLLSHEDYVKKFRGSAMKRTKLSGLQRNAQALLKKNLEKNEKDEFEK